MSDVGGVAGERLKSFIERIERLEEEKAGIANDIKEVYAEAKGSGFDTKIMRQVVRLRKMDQADREEQETLLDVYLSALGMIPSAVERDPHPDPAPAPPRGSRALRRAVEDLGTPVPVTEAEREKGVVAAFDRGGTRMSIAVPGAGPSQGGGGAEADPDTPAFLRRAQP